MATGIPEAALIEIIEITDRPDGHGIVPNEIRINGVPVLAPEGQVVTVHDMDIAARDLVKVTLTLFARRVTIGTEPKGDANV